MGGNNLILLEDGYNTSYIYAVLTAVFYRPCELTSILLTTAPPTIDAYYIQEFIKSKFIYQISKGYLIDSITINRFRLLMFNCGWLKSQNLNVLTKATAECFFINLISERLDNKLQILKYNTETNIFSTELCNIIKISHDVISKSCDLKNVMSISELLNCWCSTYFSPNISWKFEKLPTLIPIFLDIKNPETGLNRYMVNIMQSISFQQIGEGMQSKIAWDIYSLICCNSDGDYYSIINTEEDELVMISDKDVPSNTTIDIKNPDIVKKLMSEVSIILYRLQ